MTEKLLISTDTNGIITFKKDVQATCEASNSLISVFQAFQNWKRIDSIEDFEQLVSSPGDYFDSTVLKNVKIESGGLTPDPKVLASLVGLNRAEYLNLVAGLPLIDSDCPECQRAKITPGKKAISKYAFDSYREYLNFNLGTFTVDQVAVNNDLARFSTYATTEAEIELYEHFTGLVSLLNSHIERYPISSTDRITLAKCLHLQLSQGMEGTLVLNTQYVVNELNALKYKKNDK